MPNYNPPFLAKSDLPLKSYFLYENRRWYKEQTTEIFEGFNPNYVDLWYDVPFYGKVNTFGYFVYPLQDKIVYPIGSIERGVNASGFDFALNAIDDFSFFLKRGTAGGKTRLNTLLNDFKIKSSFVDAKKENEREVISTLLAFNKQIVLGGASEKIINFNQYTCKLIDYLEFLQRKITFFYNFSSNKTTIRSTGLSFEFSLQDHDNDFVKNSFYQDPEFEKYVQTAANFGFRINKNAPWMLIVDPNSDPMLKGRKVKRGYDRSRRRQRVITVPGYLQDKSISSLDQLFLEYYNSVMVESFFEFKAALITLYERYRKRMRYVVDHGAPIVSNDRDFTEIATKSFTRTKSTQRDIVVYDDDKYDDFYFLKLFEKQLKNEFKGNYKVQEYNDFKNKFNKLINTNSSLIDIIVLLEGFYSPVRIYNRDTRKLNWNSPKKQLTPAKSYVNLQSKDQPTPGKIVTEFMPDL